MKIMIIGSTGMAGHIIHNHLKLRNDFDIVNVSYRTMLDESTVFFDFYEKEKIYNFITQIKPDIIINCIGILIQEANENPEKAVYLNSYLPRYLSKLSCEINSKLIHLSTDCVFKGDKGMYSPNDDKDAQDIYGMSKALGELNNDIDLTIRTSIIGPELKTNGQGLLHWFLNQNNDINGFTNAYWSGITTLQLAKIIEQAIDSKLTGLFQYSNNTKISKFDLLNIFKKIWGKENINIIPVEGKKVDKSLISSQSPFIKPAPNYLEMCQELANYMKINNNSYSQYL